MHIGLFRITVAAALLVCFARGTLAGDAGMYRNTQAPGWTNPTHQSVSRLPVRRILSDQRFARSIWYSPNDSGRPWRATPPTLKLPGATVLTRQVLDNMDATTLRDALRYVPGATVR
jgi:hypothetical protein